MKVIFLDIDGVLNNPGSLAMGVHLIPGKVCLLSEFCIDNDIHIVISSTWRKAFKLEVLKDILWTAGFLQPNRIIGQTPQGFGFSCRGEEIQSVLDANKDITNYVIIDDDNDMLESQKHHFVHTENQCGLTFYNMKKVKEILEC